MFIISGSLYVSGCEVTVTGGLVRVGQALFQQNLSLNFS